MRSMPCQRRDPSPAACSPRNTPRPAPTHMLVGLWYEFTFLMRAPAMHEWMRQGPARSYGPAARAVHSLSRGPPHLHPRFPADPGMSPWRHVACALASRPARMLPSFFLQSNENGAVIIRIDVRKGAVRGLDVLTARRIPACFDWSGGAIWRVLTLAHLFPSCLRYD